MATDAGRLSDSSVAGLDPNWIVIVLQSERQRMKKAVVGFRHPFSNVVMWQVAIVADGNMMMTAVLPRIHMLLHDMTVNTCLWIVAQIARPFAVAKCK